MSGAELALLEHLRRRLDDNLRPPIARLFRNLNLDPRREAVYDAVRAWLDEEIEFDRIWGVDLVELRSKLSPPDPRPKGWRKRKE